jgi:hypothetical protein
LLEGERLMGAWGLGNFENDDAMNWAVEFQETPSAHLLDDPFTAVARAKGYVERDFAGYTLAAAEVAAAANGRPSEDIPQAIRDWASAHPDVASRERLARAIEAVDVITAVDRSELAELWAESEHMQDWLAQTAALKERLR